MTMGLPYYVQSTYPSRAGMPRLVHRIRSLDPGPDYRKRGICYKTGCHLMFYDTRTYADGRTVVTAKTFAVLPAGQPLCRCAPYGV